VGPLDGPKVFPRARKMRGQPCELFEVKSGKDLEPFGAIFSEMQSDHPVIVLVAGAAHETCRVSPVDEADRAVVKEQKIVGDLSDGRTTTVSMSTNGQEELVLSGGETGRPCLVLTPTLEVPKTRA
jgi:hypothetical protein